MSPMTPLEAREYIAAASGMDDSEVRPGKLKLAIHAIVEHTPVDVETLLRAYAVAVRIGHHPTIPPFHWRRLEADRDEWKAKYERAEEIAKEALQLVRERSTTLTVLAAGWDPLRHEDGRELQSALFEDLRSGGLEKVTRETVWQYAEARGLMPNFTPLMIDLNEEET